MNDRVSNKPPKPYIGEDEDCRARYEHEQTNDLAKRKLAHPRKFTNHPSPSMAESSVADRSEGSRHSSIFRFGKSLAASFNPSNWKIWKQPSQEGESAEQRALRERREKAERIYKELKTAGYFRDSNDDSQAYQHWAEQVSHQKTSLKHDSGVQFGYDQTTDTRPRMSEEMSREDKRMGRVFLEPPKFASPRATESPVSNASESVGNWSKQSFHFKKPSLSNIKKALTSESQPNLSTSGEHQARRVPSRKDIQMQMKLVKRVSDLEGRLEAARRQLAEVQSEPLPLEPPPRNGKSRFVPGALASLPSERLISGYISSEYDDDPYKEIGKAVTTDYTKNNEQIISGAKSNQPDLDKPLPQPQPETPLEDGVMQSVEMNLVEDSIVEPEIKAASAHQVNVIHKTPTTATTETSNSSDSDEEEESVEKDPTPEAKPTLKKRKSTVFERMADDGGKYKPSDSDVDSEAESEVKKSTPTKKNAAAGPRKLQKTVHKATPAKEPPSTPDVKNPSPQNQRNPAPRYQGSSKGPKLKQTPVKPQLIKSKVPRRQSASPPPSSSFTGLQYPKPSAGMTPAVAKQAVYSAIPSADGDVPPIPKMPNAVRLPSGEMISTASTVKFTNSARTGSKLTKTRPLAKEGGEREKKKVEEKKTAQPGLKEPFSWPDDVF
jgi:hypothetical protein